MLLIISGLLFYLSGEISTVASRIYGIRSSNALIAADTTQITDLRSQAQQANPYLSKLTAALPTKTNIIVLSNTVDTIATKDGVNAGFRFGSEGQPNPSGLNYVDFQIGIQGSYDNVARFVQDLENSGYYLTIDNISLVLGSAGTNLDGVMNGRAFFYGNGTNQGQ